jgi:hypothetical protein
LGAATTLNAGTGRVTLKLLDGAGNTNNTIGTITQGAGAAIWATNLDVITHGGASLKGSNLVNVFQLTNTGSAASAFNNVGTSSLTLGDAPTVGVGVGVTGDLGSVNITTTGDLIVQVQGYGGVVSSSSAGDAIILAAGGNFYDGGVGLSTPNGRWLVYSTDPGLNNAAANTLVKGDFKQYAAPIGTAPAQSTGNGFLYSISPTLTASLTGSVNGLIAKAYDSTTQIALNSSNFIVSNSLNNSDLISVAPMTGNFNSKNVGVATTVSATGLTVASATDVIGQIAVYGYQFPVNATATGSGFITPATVTLTAPVVSKTYDGTTNYVATVANLNAMGSALFTGDSVSAATLSYTDKNVGSSNKTVIISAATLNDGNGGANYQVTFAGNTTSTINQAPLTVSTSNVTKTYNANTDMTGATGQGAVVVGGTLFSGDSLSGGSFVFTDKNAGAGNKTVTVAGVTVTDGTNTNNYNVSYQNNTTSTINQAPLTISSGNVTKTYNASTDMTGATGQGAVVVSGTLFTGDSLSGGSFAFTDKNAGIGNKAVTVAGVTVTDANNNANNYNVSYQNNTTSTINKALVTVTAPGVTKTYDGSTAYSTTAADLAAMSAALIGADNVAGATLTFADKNAGTGNKVVSLSAVTINDGNGGANYTLTANGNTTSTINQAPLTVSTSNVTKTYNASTDMTGATGQGAVVVGGTLFSGDSLSGGSFAFTDKNAGSGNKAVTVAGVTVTDGTNTNNYNVSYQNNTTSTINKALVTVTAPGVTKTYDGTTTYATTPADLSAMSTALAGTDTVAGATLTFADKNAGTGNKVVSLSAITINDGNGGANYTVTANGNATSTISPLTQVTWASAKTSGNWSDPASWTGNLVPDGANVLAVSVLNGAAVTYDLTTPTTVQAINMTGSFTMATGSLAVTGNLNTPQYTQTGGTLTGTGGLTVAGNFSQSAGSIAMAGPVSITQSSGNLSAGSISGSSINLAATSGAISQSSALTTTGLLKASASNGITLTNAANAASAFSATTTGPGNIALTNAAPLDVQGITAASGNVVINNTGAISNTGAINVSGGTVDIISHSPITIGNTVNASGNITLAALTPDNTSNITLNGSMTSTAGGISIQAYNNFIQNSNLSAALAIDVSTVAGSLTFGPGAYSVGNPVTYTVNGAPYLPPWIASTLSGGATDFVVAFLDQFQAVLDAQQVTPMDDPLGLMQSSQEGIVIEGEICRP